MATPSDDQDSLRALEAERLPFRPYGRMDHFPSEDDDAPDPAPVVYRPWVVVSIGLVSLIMLLGAMLLGGVHH